MACSPVESHDWPDVLSARGSHPLSTGLSRKVAGRGNGFRDMEEIHRPTTDAPSTHRQADKWTETGKQFRQQ